MQAVLACHTDIGSFLPLMTVADFSYFSPRLNNSGENNIAINKIGKCDLLLIIGEGACRSRNNNFRVSSNEILLDRGGEKSCIFTLCDMCTTPK